MDTVFWIILIVVALVIGAAVAWFFLKNQRSSSLKKQFGPEYDRTLARSGDSKRAEKELEQRRTRVERFEIRTLPPEVRKRYVEEWKAIQARFVDNPEAAAVEADRLLVAVMNDRGYPVSDFEQRAADLSVNHPRLVENYREAHAIGIRRERGESSTEDLRRAIILYRDLFEDLLDLHPTTVESERR
jgi:hypothetical protein